MQRIYSLSDPRTGEVRYVGWSMWIRERYQSHIANSDRSNPAKNAWISELKSLGLIPILTVLDQTRSMVTASIYEKWWIQFYIRQGARLTNIQDVKRWDEKRWINTSNRVKRLQEEHRQQSAS